MKGLGSLRNCCGHWARFIDFASRFPSTLLEANITLTQAQQAQQGSAVAQSSMQLKAALAQAEEGLAWQQEAYKGRIDELEQMVRVADAEAARRAGEAEQAAAEAAAALREVAEATEAARRAAGEAAGEAEGEAARALRAEARADAAEERAAAEEAAAEEAEEAVEAAHAEMAELRAELDASRGEQATSRPHVTRPRLVTRAPPRPRPRPRPLK